MKSIDCNALFDNQIEMEIRRSTETRAHLKWRQKLIELMKMLEKVRHVQGPDEQCWKRRSVAGGRQVVSTVGQTVKVK